MRAPVTMMVFVMMIMMMTASQMTVTVSMSSALPPFVPPCGFRAPDRTRAVRLLEFEDAIGPNRRMPRTAGMRILYRSPVLRLPLVRSWYGQRGEGARRSPHDAAFDFDYRNYYVE